MWSIIREVKIVYFTSREKMTGEGNMGVLEQILIVDEICAVPLEITKMDTITKAD